MDIWGLDKVFTIHEMFWHSWFYVVLYFGCLISLAIFWKQMRRGRRFFLLFSILCLVLFIYNPVFVNLIEHYLLRGDKVIVRLFLLLPVLLTESYVLATLVSSTMSKNKVLSILISLAIVVLLFYFGITPWQREENGWDADMYMLAENPYKIPQEHIDMCNMILDDMDGERATLCMYEIHGINDIGGTLNYSIRMYTSRIQLDSVMDAESYGVLSYEDRSEFWNSYLSEISRNTTDNTRVYFVFPIDDNRIDDLIDFGCTDMGFDSQNYTVLEYTL